MLALGELGEALLDVVGLALLDRLDVGEQEAGVGDGLAGGAEVGVLPRGGGGAGAHRGRVAGGVDHLAGERAPPDQVVEPVLFGGELAFELVGGLEAVPGRADGLVGLLGVLDLAGVAPGLGGHVLGAVELGGLGAGGVDGGVRQVRRVGPHIGDVTVFIEPLGDAHHLRARQAQLPSGLLLERRGDERRVGTAAVRLLVDLQHGEVAAAQALGQAARAGLVEVDDIALRLAGGRVEVLAAGDPVAVDGDERGLEDLVVVGGETGGDVPVVGGAEGHAGPFALDDDPGGDGLDAPGRQARHDLLPQHRADLVAVEAVEDAAGLLGVDEVLVELARVGGGLGDGLRGDLVEDHALDRDLRLQRLEQVPGDGLAFAVLIGGEVELVGLGEVALELLDVGLAVGVDDVERREVVVDVDPQARPRLVLVLLRDLLGAAGQVADVPEGGVDDVAGTEIRGDRLGLRRGFDDDQALEVGHCSHLRLGSLKNTHSNRYGSSRSANASPEYAGAPARSEPATRRFAGAGRGARCSAGEG